MQKFRIRFASWSPYSIVKHTRGKTELRGIVKDIYEGMKAVKGFDYEASFQPGNAFGERTANGTWSGMLGSTINNETDIAGPFYISEERSFCVEYSVPFGFNKLGILSGLVNSNKHPFLLFGIFSLQVWLALVLSLLLVPLVACVMHKDLPSSKKRSRIDIFSKYYWAFQASLLAQGFGSNNTWFLRSVQKSLGFQLLRCTWLIAACFILMNIYKSSITSTFAASKLIPRIETIDQLVKDTEVEIGTYRHNYAHSFLKTLIGTQYEDIYHRVEKNLFPNINGSTPEWMDLVESGRLVFVAPTSQMKNHIGKRFLETGNCGLIVTEMHLASSFIALIFGKHFRDTSILKQFNQFLLKFNEGHIDHLEFSHSNLYYDICTTTRSTVSKALKLSDLLGAFIVFVAGIITSIFVFIIERILK